MASDLIPPLYADATTTLPEVQQWCDNVLRGVPARLLILGPIFSGKTYTAYAAIRRLLQAGYPSDQIAVHRGGDLALRKYDPASFDQGPPVIMLDDLTNPTDNRVGITVPHDVEDPYTQSVMAVGYGAVTDAADRLASRYASWIACASGIEQLNECLGNDVATKLLTTATVVELPPRPTPSVNWDWKP